MMMGGCKLSHIPAGVPNSEQLPGQLLVMSCAIHTSAAMVVIDAVQKRLNYDAKEISQNHENICRVKTHQKPGHISPQKN
jgi:hypothetical protein